MGTGEERVATFIDKIVPALTGTLTAKEQESGLYTPPPPPRVLFEGTLLDAQEFFQQTTPVENCYKCPIAKYTDGLPIIIPTEEAVKEMLSGTSHKADEEIKRPEGTLSVSSTTGQVTVSKTVGQLVSYAQGYKATVEKVAVCAVMAGCKPEYLPVALAIATSGGGSTNCPGTSSAHSTIFVVSGPIAKEIGMNAGQNSMDVGNPANMSLGRVGAMMSVNFGGCITGVTRTDSGNPIHNLCFAEDANGLPPTWEGYNEDSGYKKTESVVGKLTTPYSNVQQYAPSSFRGLIGEGYGGMARRLGVEGTPGPHNFLEYVIPLLIPSDAFYGYTFVMHLNMAKSLYDYGFKTKKAAYEWMWNDKRFWITVGDLAEYGWYDFRTAAGEDKEPLSGIPYRDLPKDYKVPSMGTTGPYGNCIIVSASFADELCYAWRQRPSAYFIDPWR